MQSALQWELGVEDGSWGSEQGMTIQCAAAVSVAESSQNIHGLRFRRTAGIALPLPPLRALTHFAPSLAEHLLLPPASPPTLAPHSPRAPALLSAQPPLLLLLLLFLFPLLPLMLLLLFLPHQICLLSARSSPRTAVPSFPSASTPPLYTLSAPSALPITSLHSPPLPPPSTPSSAALATTFYGLIEN